METAVVIKVLAQVVSLPLIVASAAFGTGGSNSGWGGMRKTMCGLSFYETLQPYTIPIMGRPACADKNYRSLKLSFKGGRHV